MPLGSEKEIEIGADVHAIGHPTGEAWTYVYNWPVTGLPQIASGKFLER